MIGSGLSRRRVADGEPRRFWIGCLLTFLLGVSSGCYVYAPAARTPAAGSRLLLELNDQGRVALGDSIGPTGQEVEGTMTSDSDSAYSLKVVRVGYLNGQSNQWNGEQLTIARNLVNRALERRFSSSRTWLTVSAITAATVLFIATRGLLGFGSEGRTGGGGEPGQQ